MSYSHRFQTLEALHILSSADGIYWLSTSVLPALAEQVSSWRPKDGTNVWELSGQFEGDIMLAQGTNQKSAKNVLHDTNYRWDDCVIPYSIDEHYFSECDDGTT